MKGSDKWGQGAGPRIRLDLLLAALVAVSLVGVYFLYTQGSGLSSTAQLGKVTTVSTTGVGCNDPSMPPAAQIVQQDPKFVVASAGLCYNYMGGTSTMTFASYNGTVGYPCGDAPVMTPASEILVNLTASQAVSSVQLVAAQPEAAPTCGAQDALQVYSVADVESTIPAVPQLNLTLSVPAGGRPVSSLQAVLTLDGGSQTFKFPGVSPGSPLAAAKAASSIEIILSNLSFKAGEVYPMAVSVDPGRGPRIQLHRARPDRPDPLSKP